MAQPQPRVADLSIRHDHIPDPALDKDMSVSSMDSLIRPFNSLSDLLQKPSVLSSESALLTSELTTLCHTSYPTFLLLHNTSNALSSSLSSLSTSLDSLIATVPSLHAATQHFTQTTKPILEERRKASLILDQQDKLIDLLEIPALIDTCARNGQYQDAYDLSIHATNLWERYRTQSSTSQSQNRAQQLPIIDALRKEVDRSVRIMLSSLVETLKSKAKSPALFKAVGYLRKMGDWSEEDLALLFLCCRGSYIEGLYSANAASHGVLASAAVDSDAAAKVGGKGLDAAKYLRGMIEIYREGVYDTLSAYTTIFLEHNRPTISGSPTDLALLEDLRHLLSAFTHQHTKLIVTTLHTHLHAVTDFTSLSSLLTQLNYCAVSFARVGLDFRALVQPPFEDAVVKNVKDLMEDASRTFVEELMGNEQANVLPSKWLVTAPATSAGTPITPTTPASHGTVFKLPDIPDTLDSMAKQATSTATSTSAATSISQPPQVLTFSPPLAILLNAYMSTLNSLRLLPIISALPKLHTQLCTSLAKGTKALLDYSRLITSPASPTTRVSFERHRSKSSISSEKGIHLPGTIGVGGGRPGTPTGGITPRPMSPAQRAATPTSARPLTPRTPRQSFTGNEETRSPPKHETERDIILAVGKAYVRILVPFARRALVVGVYGTQMEGFVEGISKRNNSDEVQALTELESTLGEWEKWYEEWRLKAQEPNGDSSQR